MFHLCMFMASPCAADREREACHLLIENVDVRDYASHNQTRSAVQDRRRIMYVGNKDPRCSPSIDATGAPEKPTRRRFLCEDCPQRQAYMEKS